MKKYLLDTNICIFYLKGKFQLDTKIQAVGLENCYISEITVAELFFGVENSEKPDYLRAIITPFFAQMQVIPIFGSLELYAKEKANLAKKGMIIDDFDILIGTSAVVNDMVMVTNNTAHFSRIRGIMLADWTKD